MKNTLVAAFGAAALILGSGSAMAQDGRLSPLGEHALVAHDGDVYIAAQPTTDDLDAWAAQGVTTVVNFRSQAETAALPFSASAESEARGMRYLDIPMGGADGVSPDIRTRLTALLADAEGPVVLHCRTGMRAANAYAAHLLAEGEASGEDLADFGWPGGLSGQTLEMLLDE